MRLDICRTAICTKTSREVLVVEWLMEALLALNPITPEQAEQVIYKLRACITSGGASDELITANDKFRKLLFEENSYPFGDNGDNINIRFFAAKDDEYKNRCIVTNQWEYPRKSKEGGQAFRPRICHQWYTYGCR